MKYSGLSFEVLRAIAHKRAVDVTEEDKITAVLALPHLLRLVGSFEVALDGEPSAEHFSGDTIDRRKSRMGAP